MREIATLWSIVWTLAAASCEALHFTPKGTYVRAGGSPRPFDPSGGGPSQRSHSSRHSAPLTRRSVIALPQTGPTNSTMGGGSSSGGAFGSWRPVPVSSPSPATFRKVARRRSPLQHYLMALEAYPLAVKAATTGVVGMFGDALAQVVANPNVLLAAAAAGAPGGLDLQRVAVFGAVGACYVAPLVHTWYGILERTVGSGCTRGGTGKCAGVVAAADAAGSPIPIQRRLSTAARMVVVDQVVASPVVNAGFLFFFTLLGALVTGAAAGPAAAAPAPTAAAAVGLAAAKVSANLLPTLQAAWRIWPLANLINFAFVPPHLRLLFANVVGVGWNLILSQSCN